jgi:HKD family nuclease
MFLMCMVRQCNDNATKCDTFFIILVFWTMSSISTTQFIG